MNKHSFVAFIGFAALVACNSGANKKVLIMGRGGIKANGTDITMTNGSSYAEETVEVGGDKAVTWNVTHLQAKRVSKYRQKKVFIY